MKDLWEKYLLILIISCVGGFVRYLNKKKKFKLFLCFVEVVTSMFTGLMVGLLLEDSKLSHSYVFAIVGLSSYCSTVVLELLSGKLESCIKKGENNNEE